MAALSVTVKVTGLRGIGLRPRRLCVDATSEKFFAIDLRRQLRTKIRTELIVSSEKITVEGEDMLWKVYLGNLLVQALEDGFAALPNVPWIKTDIRSVSRDRGSFSAEVLEDGGHGDVFDGCKLALHGIDAKGGPAKAEGAGTQSATRANLGKIGPRHPMATRRAI